MRRERLRSFRIPILCLYLASFLLPVGQMEFPGLTAFFVSFFYGFLAPGLLIVWSANVLFWIGFAALDEGDYRRSARYGLASLLASSPSILFIWGEIDTGFASRGPLVLAWSSGYFAWIGSIALLALVGGLAEGTDEDGRFRPRIRIRSLMGTIAAVAVVIGLWPWLARALGWSFSSAGGIGAPG